MSNEENDDRTVMMTDLPHFLKQMEAEEAAKKDTADAAAPTEAPAPPAEEPDEDHTVMMSADAAAQIDASPAQAPPATTQPQAAPEATPDSAEEDEDHTVMMTDDMVAQIDATPTPAPEVPVARPDAATEEAPIPEVMASAPVAAATVPDGIVPVPMEAPPTPPEEAPTPVMEAVPPAPQAAPEAASVAKPAAPVGSSSKKKWVIIGVSIFLVLAAIGVTLALTVFSGDKGKKKGGDSATSSSPGVAVEEKKCECLELILEGGDLDAAKECKDEWDVLKKEFHEALEEMEEEEQEEALKEQMDAREELACGPPDKSARAQRIGKTRPPETVKTALPAGGGNVDHSNPATVLQAVFDAANSGDSSNLASLCDPQGTNDGDTRRLCSLSSTHKQWGSFVEFFKGGRIDGTAKVTGDKAKLKFLFAPGKKKGEEMNFIKRAGKWYLLRF